MQSSISGCIGIGINGEIIIGVENDSKKIHTNISEGITEEILDIILSAKANGKECRIAYNTTVENGKDKYEIIRIWAGEKEVYTAQGAEINCGTYDLKDEGER